MKKFVGLLVVVFVVLFSISAFGADIAIKFLPQNGVTKYIITSDNNAIPEQDIVASADGSGIFIVSTLAPGSYTDLKVVAVTQYVLTYTDDNGNPVTSTQEVVGPARPFSLSVPELKVTQFTLATQ